MKFYEYTRAKLTTLHFLCSLQMDPISYSLILHQAKKASQWQNTQIIRSICKFKKMKFCKYGTWAEIHNT